MTNTSGAVQGALTTTAFGQAVASTGSSTDPYEFAATSRYRSDGDAGLVLVGARYYDPQAGMFISRDTHLDQLPYVYCDGDPVNEVDPSGHGPIGNTVTAWGVANIQLAPFELGIGVAVAAVGVGVSFLPIPYAYPVGVGVAVIGVGIAAHGFRDAVVGYVETQVGPRLPF